MLGENILNKKLLVLAGKKQSGKSSTAKFLYGYEMLRNGVIDRFNIADSGDLLVPTTVVNDSGTQENVLGLFDIYRKDYEFVRYCSEMIWPHVKVFPFSENLKQAVIHIFGVKPELVYGSNEDKQTPTHIKWSNLATFMTKREVSVLKEDGKFDDYLTIRDLLKEFGTRVCRTLDDSCWIDRTFDAIEAYESNISIVDDCRFINEVNYCKSKGGVIVKLNKSIDADTHSSESELDNLPDSEYDLVIDNDKMTLQEKNSAVLDFIVSLGWVEGILE